MFKTCLIHMLNMYVNYICKTCVLLNMLNITYVLHMFNKYVQLMCSFYVLIMCSLFICKTCVEHVFNTCGHFSCVQMLYAKVGKVWSQLSSEENHYAQQTPSNRSPGRSIKN